MPCPLHRVIAAASSQATPPSRRRLPPEPLHAETLSSVLLKAEPLVAEPPPAVTGGRLCFWP